MHNYIHNYDVHDYNTNQNGSLSVLHIKSVSIRYVMVKI